MSDLQEPNTWQALLGQLIANPQERARLAAAIRVKPITLQRWAEKASRPREEHIRALIKNLPPITHSLFMSLLSTDFPELLGEGSLEEHVSPRLPSEFYARVMSNLALTPQPLCRQSTQELILQQMLRHLDPDRRGLLITLTACVPPPVGGKVRSLREIGELGTPPWPRNPMEKPMFFGADSLAGYVITRGHYLALNSWEEVSSFCPDRTEPQRSMAAFPIWRKTRVTGSLIISSTQEGFFIRPRLSAIESHTHLAACIFEPEESFDPKEIELRPMPSCALQRPHLASYNQRFLQKLAQVTVIEQQFSLQEVYKLVWQDLEEVLIQAFLQTGVSCQSEDMK